VAESVDLQEGVANPSRLLARVLAGEEIVITRRGTEVARLVPARPVRRLGVDRGRFVVPSDFDAPLPDSVFGES
jgi:prevent-host-death family protein